MTTTVSGGGGGGIDGLTSDGNKGVVIAGGITAGDPINGSLFNYSGNQTIQDVSDSGQPLLELDQTATAGSALQNKSALRILRGFQPTAHTVAPVIFVENDDTSSTAPSLSYTGPSGGQGSKIGVEGGIGTLGHNPPTAPRTLAQSVITAITDANAKTAIQACANALVDIGALTLT